MHMEVIADAANVYTREEINGPRHATKYDDNKITANKDKQTPPLSPGGKGLTTEIGTNLQTNKATELIVKKETT